MFKNSITPTSSHIPPTFNEITPRPSEITPIDDKNTPKFRSFQTFNLKKDQLFKENSTSSNEKKFSFIEYTIGDFFFSIF